MFWRKLAFFAILLGLAALTTVFARPNQEIPETKVNTSGTQYISPNGDGIQEASEIEFEVTVFVKSLEGYIPEYGIRITGSGGNVVKEIIETEEQDIGWFRRLFRAYEAYTLTRKITWDGMDQDGNLVADGTYDVNMWVVAADEQRADISLDSFVVDVTAPSVTVIPPEYLYFSPNGDDNFETIVIEHQNGTIEDKWEAAIVDSSDQKIRTYAWNNGVPENIVWDGIGDDAELAADGFYRYQIAAADRSGNSFETSFENIELDTTDTPVSISVSPFYVSPNGDGILDDLTISLSQDVDEDIVSWSLVIDDGKGTVSRRYEGTDSPPGTIIFDGLDDGGRSVKQGTYRAVFGIKYRTGNNPIVKDDFVIDVTKPDIDANITSTILSPNGDGRFEKIEATFKSSEIVTWKGEIYDGDDNVVLQTSSDETTSLVVWQGQDPDGNVVPDGDYFAQAVFTDVAGNSRRIGPEKIIIDVTLPQVAYTIDKDYFSPDGDGIKDTVTATFTTSEPVRGILSIEDEAGRDVGTVGGFGRAYQYVSGTYTYEWNGISGSGLIVPGGTYTVKTMFEDLAGNRSTAAPVELVVDIRKASLSISSPDGFSPNNDGKAETISIEVIASFYDTVDEWKVSYVDGSGKVMNSEEGTEILPREFTWDGSMRFTDSEIKALEGLYTVQLDATYRKGDKVKATTLPFFVDVTPPAVNLQATADPFAQINGSVEGDIFITLQIDDAHEVTDWALDVVTPDGEIVRSFTGRGDIQDHILWKGQPEKVRTETALDQMILRVHVVDEVGNETDFEQEVPLDLLLAKKDGKYYILVPDVIFGAYKFALDSKSPEIYESNIESIDRVIEIFNKYTKFGLLLEGHALNIYRDDPNGPEKENKEEEVLVPLTENRAKSVKAALAERGMDEDRIEIQWFGGKHPIVDVHDREVWWKNRRVEFIMLLEDKE